MKKDVFHPAYGLTDELRLRLCEEAMISSVKDVAEENNLSQAAIYKWLKLYKEAGVIVDKTRNTVPTLYTMEKRGRYKTIRKE